MILVFCIISNFNALILISEFYQINPSDSQKTKSPKTKTVDFSYEQETVFIKLFQKSQDNDDIFLLKNPKNTTLF